MKTLLDEIRNGKRYTDGINEIIYNKNGMYFHKTVFLGKWKECTEIEVTRIINVHQEIAAGYQLQ